MAISTLHPDRPRIAITLGDPAGIGPEVILKALARPEIPEICTPIIVGDIRLLERAQRWVPQRVQLRPVASLEQVEDDPASVAVLDLPAADADEIPLGTVSAAAGAAAAEAIVRAVELAQRGQVAAIVTAPINKEALQIAGYPFPGHTELLAHLTGSEKVWMLLLAGSLRTLHVSTHLSLREAIARVRTERVLGAIRALAGALPGLGFPQPRIGVAGLNPHAGEGGLFGEEDAREIAPAVAQARAEGIQVSGPEPPDTLFFRAAQGEFDGIVAMYHDQGHIPAKLLGFDIGVNVSLGLPIIRTSVDHGTAFDIAGKGIARERSMLEAIRVAVQLARHRAAAQTGGS